jgi:glutathione S-transferase
MITVWGRATSSNVQAVMWAIAELGLTCKRLDVGGAFGGTDTPQYLAMNPNRLVPVLRDGDGPFLWESAAIVRYLAARYGDRNFWPPDPEARAVVDKWAEWIKTTFVPAFLGGVFLPIISKRPTERDLTAIANGISKLKPVAAIFETGIPPDGYLGGRQPCFADIIVGVYLYRYFDLEFERADTPRLAAYYRRLTGRATYAQHVMVSYDSLRAK